MSDQSQIGLTGLAVMGANLARNIARHGYSIAVHNRTPAKTRDFVEEFGGEGAITGPRRSRSFVAALERPRKIMIMVKAGGPVDAVIDELSPLLDKGDIVIDGGNSHFHDTAPPRARRAPSAGCASSAPASPAARRARCNGPSIMPGGDREAWAEVEEILTAIAVEVDGTPCCVYVGPDGAGHYVKMVHNGIEYADMQLIAEAYDLLRNGAGLSVAEIASTFEEWNRGDLESFLIEITAKVLSRTDEATGGPLVDVILDQAEQKGTGRWTSQDALELGVPLTAITEAGVRPLAVGAARPARRRVRDARRPAARRGRRTTPSIVDDVRAALYASKVVAYAQGFEQMAAASRKHDWDLDLGDMATIWRGGCIIRARFLNRIRRPTTARTRW